MSFNNYYRKIIYCDMDSVLTDFNAQWLKRTKTGMSARDFEEMYGKEEFYEELKKYGVSFWSEMSWTVDGKLLWNYIKKYRPIILTTPTIEESCRDGKEIWVHNNLQSKTEIIFTDEKEHWGDSNSILIDDKGTNVRKFLIAGGDGIIHVSAVETITELKNRFGM